MSDRVLMNRSRFPFIPSFHTLPLVPPTHSYHAHAFLIDLPVKASSISFVAGRSDLVDFEQDRVGVAVEEDGSHGLGRWPLSFSLPPILAVLTAAPVSRLAGLQGFFKGLAGSSRRASALRRFRHLGRLRKQAIVAGSRGRSRWGGSRHRESSPCRFRQKRGSRIQFRRAPPARKRQRESAVRRSSPQAPSDGR